jgi:hypothetical protein
MSIPKHVSKTWLAAALLTGLLSLAVIRTVFATNEPVLTISKTGANQYEISITNGTNNAYYELYHTPVLADTAYPFILLTTNAQGQTNFTVNAGVNLTGFFVVGVGRDWDGDGIENYRDANPISTNIGQLSITIDSPTNGMVFQ